MITWRARAHKPREAASSAAYLTNQAKPGTRRSPVISDRGVQYTSIRYAERLGDIGAVRSVGSKGDSYDNAAAESVNSLYKKELIDRDGPWYGVRDVTFATMEWVAWYNNERLHSACGYISAKEFEENHYTQQDALVA
jgi:putative transposase